MLSVPIIFTYTLCYEMYLFHGPKHGNKFWTLLRFILNCYLTNMLCDLWVVRSPNKLKLKLWRRIGTRTSKRQTESQTQIEIEIQTDRQMKGGCTLHSVTRSVSCVTVPPSKERGPLWVNHLATSKVLTVNYKQYGMYPPMTLNDVFDINISRRVTFFHTH